MVFHCGNMWESPANPTSHARHARHAQPRGGKTMSSSVFKALPQLQLLDGEGGSVAVLVSSDETG